MASNGHSDEESQTQHREHPEKEAKSTAVCRSKAEVFGIRTRHSNGEVKMMGAS